MTENTQENNQAVQYNSEQPASDVVTVVFTADNHLGYTSFGQQPSKREERQRRLRAAFQQAADFAVVQGVDLFIQAGDLFDTVTPDERDRSFVAERLARLKQAGIATFALGGMHDTPANTQSVSGETTPAPQLSYANLRALHYLPPVQDGPIEPVLIDVHGILVGICGVGMLAGQEGDPLARLQVRDDIERARIALLVMHAPIEGFRRGEIYRAPDRAHIHDALVGSSLVGTELGTHPAKAAAAASPNHLCNDASASSSREAEMQGDRSAQAGSKEVFMTPSRGQVARSSIRAQNDFAYILAGYHHNYSRTRIGQTEVIVAGSTQHVDFSTPDATPGFVFMGLAADGVRWCNHIAIDTLRLHRLVIATSDLWPKDADQKAEPDEDPTESILDRVRPLCSAEAMIQLLLEGELTRGQYHQLDLNRIRRYGEEHCFALAIDDSALLLLSESEVGARFIAPTSMTPSSGETHERFSPREELVALADEWIALASDEREKKALQATKEELLLTLDSRHNEMRLSSIFRPPTTLSHPLESPSETTLSRLRFASSDGKERANAQAVGAEDQGTREKRS